MDTLSAKNAAADAAKFVENYVRHPITQAVYRDSKEEQEKVIQLLCDCPVKDLQTFFAHFEAIGHLRGLRRAQAIITDQLEETQEALKQATNEHAGTE